MAGASTRDIKRRIRSFRNMQQITKAMEMVAAAKLRRAQVQVVQGRPFAEKLREVLERLVRATRGVEGSRSYEHPLLAVRPVRRVGYLVVTSDRGLAGGYNANLLRTVQSVLREAEHPAGIVVVGRKGRDFLRRRGYPLEEEFVGLGDEVDFAEARQIARTLMQYFEDGRFDEVYLVYNRFINPATQRPTVEPFLPLAAGVQAGGPAADEGPEGQAYLYEPSPGRVLDILIPRYAQTQVYHALMEAKASEFGARMTAMHSATDNAQELIENLTLSFNRARQAGITKEISEIVGGAAALGGA